MLEAMKKSREAFPGMLWFPAEAVANEPICVNCDDKGCDFCGPYVYPLDKHGYVEPQEPFGEFFDDSGSEN
jgi:hypothetical protein